MSFIVQISPFVHLFTLKIVFRWVGFAPLNLLPPHQGSILDLLGPDPSPQIVSTFHFIPSYAPGYNLTAGINPRYL
jgi:hypothetical protein